MNLTTQKLRAIIVEELRSVAEDARVSVKSIAQSAASGCSSAVAAAIGNDEEIVQRFLATVRSDSDSEPGRILRAVVNDYLTPADLDDIALEMGAAAVKAAINDLEIDSLSQDIPSRAGTTQAIKPLSPGSTEIIDIPGEEFVR